VGNHDFNHDLNHEEGNHDFNHDNWREIMTLIMTTEGMAPECNRVNKRLAEKIAEKRREPYASIYHNVH